MDTPVLNAVKEGKPVETPVSRAKGADTVEWTFTDQTTEGEDSDEDENSVITEIRYRDTIVESEETRGGFTYGMLFAIMLGVLVLILITICIYNKFVTKRKDVKEVTDQSPIEKVQA